MELFFRKTGRGPAAVILHGLFGSSANWSHVAKALSAHYTVYVPDLPNFGKSPHTSDLSYASMADAVWAFMDDQKRVTARLVGHSMGGKVAMHMALNRPQRVDALAVVDIAPGAYDNDYHQVTDALFAVDLDTLETYSQARGVLEQRLGDPMLAGFLLMGLNRGDDGRFSWRFNLDLIAGCRKNLLAAVEGPPFHKPCAFIRGELSDYITPAHFPVIRRLFPKSRIITIKNAGHWVHGDAPEEFVTELKKALHPG